MSRHSHNHTAVAAAEVLDPVCVMTISPEDAVGHVDYKGQTGYFCSQSCLDQFRATPDAFIGETLRSTGNVESVPIAAGNCVQLRLSHRQCPSVEAGISVRNRASLHISDGPRDRVLRPHPRAVVRWERISMKGQRRCPGRGMPFRNASGGGKSGALRPRSAHCSH